MPLPSTMTPIATNTLVSAAGTVTFSSIPQTYTDLVLVFNGKNGTGNNYEITTQLNGDTGSNYSYTNLRGNGSAASSFRESSITAFRLFYTESTMGNAIISFNNYANTTTYKTYLSRSNSPSFSTDAIVGLWRSTAAVTSIAMTVVAGAQFQIGSTFTLYGVKAA